MATRSIIGRLNDDSTITYIYCHSDGDWVGIRLDRHYNTPDQVDRLIELGSLSNLQGNLRDCDAHHRDWGRPHEIHAAQDIPTFLSENMDQHCAEYAYLYMNERWYGFGRMNGWIDCLAPEDSEDYCCASFDIANLAASITVINPTKDGTTGQSD